MSSLLKSPLVLPYPKACCAYKKIASVSSTTEYSAELIDNILQFLIAEEAKMDKWYCNKNNGFLYYYSSSPSKRGGRNALKGGAPGCLFGLRKKKNYIVPAANTPVQPIPVDEPVELPADIISLIVGETLKETSTAIKSLNLTSQNTRVRELHEILAKTLNTLSASKLLRRSMYEQLESMRKEQAADKKTEETILKDLNVRIYMILAEVRIAIESKGSRIKCATKQLYNFLRDVGLEDMANDLIPNIFVSLKEWNLDAYVVMIENAVRAKISAQPHAEKALASLLLPYGKFNESITKIFDCMMNIMLNVPSNQSSCTLILSDTTGTDGINIKIEYQKIVLIPLNQGRRKELSYNYYMTEEGKTQFTHTFVKEFTSMIGNIPYLKFVEFNVTVDGVENIIVDFETIVNTYPLSFFIAKGARNIPEGRRWILSTPLKYLVGKFEKELYANVCASHQQDRDKIYKLLGELQEALKKMKTSSGGAKKRFQ